MEQVTTGPVRRIGHRDLGDAQEETEEMTRAFVIGDDTPLCQLGDGGLAGCARAGEFAFRSLIFRLESVSCRTTAFN